MGGVDKTEETPKVDRLDVWFYWAAIVIAFCGSVRMVIHAMELFDDGQNFPGWLAIILWFTMVRAGHGFMDSLREVNAAIKKSKQKTGIRKEIRED